LRAAARKKRADLLEELIDLASSDSTNPFWQSALSGSILSGGIPSLNHAAIAWH